MIRMRIEFLNEQEHEHILEVLNENFEIVEQEKVKPSKQEGSKFKLQYLSMVMKDE